MTRGYGPHQEPILLGHTQLLPVRFDLHSPPPPQKGPLSWFPISRFNCFSCTKILPITYLWCFLLGLDIKPSANPKSSFEKSRTYKSKFDQKDFFKHKKILKSISALGCKATLHCSQPLGRFACCRLWNAMMVRGLMLKKSANIFKIVVIKLEQTYLAAFHVCQINVTRR